MSLSVRTRRQGEAARVVGHGRETRRGTSRVRVGTSWTQLYAFPLFCLAHGSTSLLRPFPAAACLSAASNALKTQIRVQARTQARTRTRTRPRTDGKVQEIVHDAIVWPRQACTPSDAAPRGVACMFTRPRCRSRGRWSCVEMARAVRRGVLRHGIMVHGRSVCAD